MNFVTWNWHSTNANFDQLRHIATCTESWQWKMSEMWTDNLYYKSDVLPVGHCATLFLAWQSVLNVLVVRISLYTWHEHLVKFWSYDFVVCCVGEYDKRWRVSDPLQQPKGAGITVSQHIRCYRPCWDQAYVGEFYGLIVWSCKILALLQSILQHDCKQF